MFETVHTNKARRAIVISEEEARNLNDSFIGPEHLLLGLIRVTASPPRFSVNWE